MAIVDDLEFAIGVKITVKRPGQFAEMQLDDSTWVPLPDLVHPGENPFFRRWADAWIESLGTDDTDRRGISASVTTVDAVRTGANDTEDMARRLDFL